ncbi:MAG TPA: caspase family protein [Patescibacteria group bacterium]|nr:caspase family protein [Patescibacteria group bacterium]
MPKPFSYASAGFSPHHFGPYGPQSFGNINTNVLTGDSSDNDLTGTASNDTLSGGAGNDTLNGGTGDDLLTGGTGDDLYWFDAPWGNDTITSVAAGDGNDSIYFGGSLTGQDLSVSEIDDTLFITSNYGSITLQNWSSSQLNTVSFSDGSTESISDLLSATSAESDDHALIIGIGDYPGFSSDLAGVTYDVSDVEYFLASDDVWTGSATDVITDQEATQTNIVTELTEMASEVSTGDDVLIYYSGHGCSDGSLALYDETEYTTAELYKAITALGAAVGSSGHVSVILDTCYSGSLVDYFNSYASSSDSSQYSILTACSSSQYSYDSNTNGVFTHYLFDNALTGNAADSNGDSSITIQEAYQYLTSSTYSQYASVQLYGSGSYVIA